MEKVKLSKYIKQIRGVSYKPEDVTNELDKNAIPILRANNITADGHIDLNDIVYVKSQKVQSEQLLRAGDIFICASSGSKNLVGKAVYIPTDMPYAFGAFCKVVRPISENIDKHYLAQFFQSPAYRKKISDLAQGANINNIKNEHIDELDIAIYSLEEQKAIAERLDKVSGLIEKRKAQLEKLNLLIKSRFIEMFGEVGTNNKGWGLKRLGDCCTINPKKSEDKRLHQELIVSFVPMPAVSEKGEIDASETKSYDEVKTGFTYFAEQDVLFAKITPCMENGKGAIAKGLCNGIGFGSTEFHVLRPIKGVSNPYWLYTVTAFKQFRMDAASNMTGSAGQRRVPAAFLDTYKVSLPPIELQNQFATFVEQVDKSKFEIQKSLEKLETLKKALMQKYFG